MTWKSLAVAILLAASTAAIVVYTPATAQQQAGQPDDPRQKEAAALFQQGQSAAKARQFAHAILLFERALALREQALGKEHTELVALTNELAGAYRELSRYAEALRYYQRSLAIYEKALGAWHPYVATTLNGLGVLHQRRGEYATALPLFERSLAIYEKALGREDTHVAWSLHEMAVLYRRMGDHPKALPLAERSLAIYEKALGREHPYVGVSLTQLAVLHWAMGDYATAFPLAERSLILAEKAHGPTHPDVAAGLSTLGQLYRDTGDYTKALALTERSLAITEKALGREHPYVATSLNNLAQLHRAMGNYGTALRHYERGLEIREKVFGREHPETATSLHDLGAAHWYLGDNVRALQYYELSMAISEKILGRDHPDVASNLDSLAALHVRMGKNAKALPLLERGLAIRERGLGREHPALMLSLGNLAAVYSRMGEHAKALSLYERSLEISENAVRREHPIVATILNNLANLYRAMGQYAKARPLHERALAIASRANTPETVFWAYNGLRATWANEGQPELAIFFGKQAVNTIQGMRARLTELDSSLQRSFLQNKAGIYRGLADLLIDEGRLPEAQQVLSMLKEEEFFDFIRRDAKQDTRTTQTTLNAQEAGWQKRYQEVAGRLAALGAELEELRRSARLGLTDAEQSRRGEVEADLRTARLAFDQFLGSLMKEVEQAGAARAREVGERGLANLRALQGTLATLGQGVVALHYLMGEEKLRVLLTTPSVQLAREAKIGAQELNRKIEQFRRALQNPKSQALPVAQELYQLLLAPVAEDLRQAKAQTLMVSLDGALRYIPLAALHDGKGYVVEHYRLAIFTEAAKDKLKDTPQAQWRLAGLGLTRQVEGFSALPAVRQELEGIVKTGERGVLPGEAHFDEAFTAARMRTALDKAYPVLHVASHFVFRPGTESNSFLLLGDGTRLTLRELKENDYDFRNVDLITLSACETAVGGGKDANGMEIEGFGALAQRQGARGVIATLWPVADESTGLLMQNFYRLREAEKLTKAEAMRQAQLMMIRGETAATGGSAQRGLTPAQPATAQRYTHPYFWAPFILMGNWL